LKEGVFEQKRKNVERPPRQPETIFNHVELLRSGRMPTLAARATRSPRRHPFQGRNTTDNPLSKGTLNRTKRVEHFKFSVFPNARFLASLSLKFIFPRRLF